MTSAGIVLSGCIRAEQTDSNGTLRVIALHRAGALFGDVLMSSQMQKSPVDIVAAEETEVLFLPLANIMREEGGATEVGDNVVIGGNAFLTSSVAPNTVVSVKTPEMNFRGKRHKE